MAKQTWTTGDVLTATAINALQANDYNQTVSEKTISYTLVAADVGTRISMTAAGATTITVNTALFSAGDTLVIQNKGAGTCTVTAGTATVSTSGTLALAQYAAGTLYFVSTGVAIFYGVPAGASSALTLITPSSTANSGGSVSTSGGAVTATTVTSLSLNGVFSATYANYLIIVSSLLMVTAVQELNLRLRASGSDTSSGYYAGGLYVLYDGTGNGNSTKNNASEFGIGNSSTTQKQSFQTMVSAPNLAIETSVNYLSSRRDAGVFGAGYQNSTTQFDGFTLFSTSGASFVVRCYGYGN